MAAKKFVSKENLSAILQRCRDLFAPKTLVEENEDDLNYYVLDLETWYNENLKFDINETIEQGGDST